MQSTLRRVDYQATKFLVERLLFRFRRPWKYGIMGSILVASGPTRAVQASTHSQALPSQPIRILSYDIRRITLVLFVSLFASIIFPPLSHNASTQRILILFKASDSKSRQCGMACTHKQSECRPNVSSEDSIWKVTVIQVPPRRRDSPTSSHKSPSSTCSQVLVWDCIEQRKLKMPKSELFDIVGKRKLQP